MEKVQNSVLRLFSKPVQHGMTANMNPEGTSRYAQLLQKGEG